MYNLTLNFREICSDGILNLLDDQQTAAWRFKPYTCKCNIIAHSSNLHGHEVSKSQVATY